MEKINKLLQNIIWLFVIGCFTGFILESIWYYFKHGIFINKQGVLYGPFKPIYGLGILIITSIFYNKKKMNNIAIFILGVIVGSIYEYLTSLFQEYILGTSTWNYSTFNLNLNGRIYLPYCIGWGLFSLIYIKYIYPKLNNLISKIPLWFSYIVAIFMISNLIISGLSVYQYSNRVNNIKTNNKILKKIDSIYDDEFMKKKFPKLKVIKKNS